MLYLLHLFPVSAKIIEIDQDLTYLQLNMNCPFYAPQIQLKETLTQFFTFKLRLSS